MVSVEIQFKDNGHEGGGVAEDEGRKEVEQ